MATYGSSYTTGGASGGTPYGTAYQQSQQQQQKSNSYGSTAQPKYTPPTSGYSPSPYTGQSYTQTPSYSSGYGTGAKTGTGFNTGYQTPTWGNQQGQVTGYGMFDSVQQGHDSEAGITPQSQYPQQQQPQYNPNDPSIDFIDPVTGQPHYNPQYGQNNNSNNNSPQQQPGAGGSDRDLYPGEPGYNGPGQGIPRQGDPGYVPNPTSGEGPGVPGSVPPPQPGAPGSGPPSFGMTWDQYSKLNPEQKAAYDSYVSSFIPGQQMQYNQADTQQTFKEDQTRYWDKYRNDLIQQGFSNDVVNRQVQEAIDQGKSNRYLAGLNYNLENKMADHTIQQDQFGNTITTANLQNQTKLTDAQVAKIAADMGIDLGKLANETGMTKAQINDMIENRAIQRTGQANEMTRWQGDNALATRAQGFNEKMGEGNLNNQTRLTTAQIDQMAGQLGIDRDKLKNDMKMTDAQINDMVIGRGLQSQELKDKMTQWKGENALATRKQGFEETMGAGQLQLGRDTLTSQTGQWQGAQRIDQQRANDDARLRGRELDQQATKMAQDYGISVEQLKQTKWYQQQQVQIEQQRLAQTGQLENRGMDISEWTAHDTSAYNRERLAQEAVLGREQMRSAEQMNLMSAFGRLQAPQSRVVRNF